MSELATVVSVLAIITGCLAFGVWIADLPNRRARTREIRAGMAHQSILLNNLRKAMAHRHAVVASIISDRRANAPMIRRLRRHYVIPARYESWRPVHGYQRSLARRAHAYSAKTFPHNCAKGSGTERWRASV